MADEQIDLFVQPRRQREVVSRNVTCSEDYTKEPELQSEPGDMTNHDQHVSTQEARKCYSTRISWKTNICCIPHA